MRRYIVLFLFYTVATSAAEDSKESLQIGVMFGPAIPSEAISDVYDLANDQGLEEAYDVASNLGYDVGAKLRFGLSESFSFSGGITFVGFPNQEMILHDSTGFTYHLQTTTNIVPIYAGIAWVPIHSLLTPVVGAHVLFSHRWTEVSDGNVVQSILSPGQEVEPSVSRFGASLNAGLEIDLGLTPFIDFAYCWSNLAGNDEGEAVRSFLTVNVGLMF